jgi:hypothetical protein
MVKEGENMKKYSILFICLVVVALNLPAYAARPFEATTNVAAGKSAYGTFSNAGIVTDGKIRGLGAASGDITDGPQYLTIDLGKPVYLDRVKIFWDKNAFSNDFSIRTSGNAKYWVEEASGIDAGNGAIDDAAGTIAISVSLKQSIIGSRYIQVKIPAGTKVTKGNSARIVEVEVYPAVDLKLAIEQIGPYVLTENSCIIKYRTSIGVAGGSLLYGTNPNKLDKLALTAASGLGNSIPIETLAPRTTYFYQVKTADLYGNTVTSKVGNFTTLSENIALNKKVTGTFTALPPAARFVKLGSADEILARITDGKTSYFTAMATSGPVTEADQYAVIDLGKTYNIKNIVSYWRELAYPESLIVQVSDNEKDWKTIESGANVAGGAFARSDAGDPMVVFNTKGEPGRYIKLLVAKGSPYYHKHDSWNFVQLMEVKAYAE